MSRRRQVERDRPYWPHSQDHVDVQEPLAREALDGAQACVLGCTNLGEHKPSCPCHTECPQHEGHCTGCAPRPAYDDTLLCGRCFHRRLRSPIRQMPTIHAWLGARMGGVKSPGLERDVSGSRDAPIPLNPAMHDVRELIEQLLCRWADRVATEHEPPIRGPDHRDVAACAAYLDAHVGWVSKQAWVATLIVHVKQLTRMATGLAPWQQAVTKLPIPCTRCQQPTLVLYGGDDWVTCTNKGCDNIIGWGRYQNLARAIVKLHTRDAG